jgi:hypothetical protein
MDRLMPTFTAQNGNLTDSQLAAVPGSATLRLRPDAAASWGRVAVAAAADHESMVLTAAYRAYGVQVDLFRARYVTYRTGIDPRVWDGLTFWRRPGMVAAAVPGTSNHGLGVAVDAVVGDAGSIQYRELAHVGIPRGWSNAEGESIGEPWHWDYTPTNDHFAGPVPAPIQEDDMPLSPADLDAVGERVKDILRAPEFQGYLRDVPWGHPISGAGMGPAGADAWLRDARVGVLDVDNVVHGLIAQVAALSAQIAALAPRT